MVELDPNVTVQIFLVAISAITAIIIWKKMSESNTLVKKSNDLIMLELKHKFEPQLRLTQSKIQYETDKITANFTCKITNKGTTSLDNLIIYDHVITKSFDLNEILDKESDIKSQIIKSIISFPPDTEIHDLKVTFQESNQEILKIILWLEFDHVGEHQQLIFVQHFKNLASDGYDLIPYSQIQSARNN